MKLTTPYGQFDLPNDFSLNMERNNPMMNEEGDSSIPASLPASSRNLNIIDHCERIDRANRYLNKMEARLEVGPVHKSGHLVIDTVHRHNGIEASFAIDNSDLYVKSKKKSLKDIISDANEGAGYKVTYASIDAACQLMASIYNGNMPNSDFFVFPVAVSPYEEGEDDDKRTVYQYNNEVGGPHGLVYEERFVHEGDVNMLVPKGYGIAPFLKLQRMIDILFECMGYRVVENCFIEAPYFSHIAVVHNCADCLVREVLDYRDLVPSCTLSEFLEWLLAKFHVQPIVDSESKEVRVVKMEDMLTEALDPYQNADISKKVIDDWTVQMNPSKRVVLTPTCEIEGTEPAAETFDKLIEKYGEYIECDENQYWSLYSGSPVFVDCLILRKATGEFYLIERSLTTNAAEPKRLGTNYFTYDRNNSDETENFTQNDVMPLMLCGIVKPTQTKDVVPYIGERLHFHTSYEDKSEDGEQKIIVVQAKTHNRFFYRTTGTTQMYIPFDTIDEHHFWFGMDNYTMYREFWKKYNELLLNNPAHVTARIKYNIAEFLSMDMSKVQLCNGRRLLPVKASATLGDRMGMTEAEFLLAEDSMDGIKDVEIRPAGSNRLKWQLRSESDASTAANIYVNHVYSSTTTWRGFSVEHDGKPDPIWIGLPSELGEIRQITALARFTIKTREMVSTNYNGTIVTQWINGEWRADGYYLENGRCLDPGPFDYMQLTKTYVFEAVSV